MYIIQLNIDEIALKNYYLLTTVVDSTANVLVWFNFNVGDSSLLHDKCLFNIIAFFCLRLQSLSNSFLCCSQPLILLSFLFA